MINHHHLKFIFFWVLKFKRECEGPEMSPPPTSGEQERQKVVETFSSGRSEEEKRLRKN